MKTAKIKAENKRKQIILSFYKALKSFGTTLPILIGVILLIGLFKVYIPSKLISSIFTGELFRDTLIGSIMGSILVGNPITSYIIGGELLNEGVSLFAVTAFIAAWVTVGLIQLPAEASILGKRFALMRNALSFLFSILVALATVLTLKVIT
ncbi:MAG: permease [Candidatus Thermoplasmatota archaeon]|nr:permease [Candidatus Thermoplasmatota archaeon]